MSRTEPRIAEPRITAPLVATDESFDLAEGPVWDPVREKLLWVDIRKGMVLTGSLADGRISIEDRLVLDGMVGSVAVAANGDWILAGERALVTRAADGVLASGPDILSADSGRRLNDGKVDPAGRFLVGTLKIDESETVVERLIQVDADGSLVDLDSDLTLSNGLGWSPDGTKLYSIDTVRRVVNVRDYDAATGATGPRRVLLTTEDGRYPDGMCVDAEGCLWVAIWAGSEVRRYSPDGAFMRSIDVPAPHPSCVAFAGPGLATMVITTATKGLGDEQLAEFPLSGRLFTVDAGVTGLATTSWSGHPLYSGGTR